MKNLTVKFNNIDYTAKYNKQTKYYEIDLKSAEIGGIYSANVKYTDLLGNIYEDSKKIQVLAKEKMKIDTNKVFMWIFDKNTFEVKDIVEIADYEINIDEETNANTIIKVLKNTTAKSNDIISIKKNNEIIYWGVIQNINNEDGKLLYEYIVKYITNIFDEKVTLSKNTERNEIEDGYYRIKSVLDTKKVLDVVSGSVENGANIQLYENNNTDAQKFHISKNSDGFYTIQNIKSKKALDVAEAKFENNINVQQYQINNSDAQKWKIEHVKNTYYRIKTKINNLCITVDGGKTENNANIKIYEQLAEDNEKQKFVLEKLEEQTIKENGIEDYIEKTIKENFINNEDIFLNKKYIEIRVKTHTKLQTSVTNVQDNIYNLHTWMTNCTQLYNINYNFYYENKKLIIEIENKTLDKELIDATAQAISNYTEVFETDIVSKVEVLTDTKTYYLYLLNDRTTTTNMSDENRAIGRTERVYTAKIEDAEQKALDTIQANKYNHMITFNMLKKIMSVGTPISIKTKKSLIFDTYISAIKITSSKFYEYTCGNIRIKFIDKIKQKERKEK